MKWRILATFGGVLLLAGGAVAQPPRPGGVAGTPRPAFSPYLNLVRPGGSTALNYYGLVRPEIQARNAIQNLQGGVALNQQAIGDVQAGLSTLPTTGHQAMFLNHQGYFLTGGAVGGAGGMRAGASLSSPTRPKR